jgi:hypothetical protein
MYENRLLCKLIGYWFDHSIAMRIAVMHAWEGHHKKEGTHDTYRTR